MRYESGPTLKLPVDGTWHKAMIQRQEIGQFRGL